MKAQLSIQILSITKLEVVPSAYRYIYIYIYILRVTATCQSYRESYSLTKGNLQNKLDDRSFDFTKGLNNDESNTYHQTIPRVARDEINFSDLLKTLKEDDKTEF